MSRFWQFAQLSDAYKNDSLIDLVLDERPGALFIGGLKAIDRPDVLTEQGITHILSILEYDHCDYDEYAKYQRMWISAEDHASQNLLQQFEKTNAFVEQALSANGRVLVHCAMGVSRSATIVCAYLMHAQKSTFLDALRLLQKARPSCAPNVGFIEQLEVYERIGNASSAEQKHLIYFDWLKKHTGDSKL